MVEPDSAVLTNPLSGVNSTAPPGYPGAVSNAFNNSAPDYYLGLSLNIPIRNRVAKSDQYRAELEMRQAELRLQQLKKQIRIEVRNAQYALVQSQARVESARKARDLADKTFDISSKEQELGAGSNYQTLTARRDLAAAESALVAAMTAYQKAVDRGASRDRRYSGCEFYFDRIGEDGNCAAGQTVVGGGIWQWQLIPETWC